MSFSFVCQIRRIRLSVLEISAVIFRRSSKLSATQKWLGTERCEKRSIMHQHHCPTCGRRFKSIRDYPRVLVLSYERLPIPEAVDRFSEAAAEKSLARKRGEGRPANWSGDDGINRTPEIASACARADVQQYLERLAQLAGQIVDPAEL